MAGNKGHVGRVSGVEEESRELFETANAVVVNGRRFVLLWENTFRVCSFQSAQNDKTEFGVSGWLLVSLQQVGRRDSDIVSAVVLVGLNKLSYLVVTLEKVESFSCSFIDLFVIQ